MARNAQVYYASNPQMKINSLNKHEYLIHTCSDKAFKGTIVNRALPSLLEGLLEITLIIYLFVFDLCEETISRTDKGQPRPKYIFNKCGTNFYFFTLQRFGQSPSPNFKLII